MKRSAALRATSDWTEWAPFDRTATGPAEPGVYRFRATDDDAVAYIGETGSVTMARRFERLRPVNSAEMPYRYPYAAAPALWALRHRSGAPLEVSWQTIADGPARLARWVNELATFRVENGRSPVANFGRMPVGYRSSSSYSCDLMHEGALYRGGPSRTRDERHVPGRAPFGPIDPNVHAPTWAGLAWTPWTMVAPPAQAHGFVRTRSKPDAPLVALAHGVLRAGANRARKAAGGHAEHSWFVTNDWPEHHVEELEVDLLAGHLRAFGRLPGR